MGRTVRDSKLETRRTRWLAAVEESLIFRASIPACSSAIGAARAGANGWCAGTPGRDATWSRTSAPPTIMPTPMGYTLSTPQAQAKARERAAELSAAAAGRGRGASLRYSVRHAVVEYLEWMEQYRKRARRAAPRRGPYPARPGQPRSGEAHHGKRAAGPCRRRYACAATNKGRRKTSGRARRVPRAHGRRALTASSIFSKRRSIMPGKRARWSPDFSCARLTRFRNADARASAISRWRRRCGS